MTELALKAERESTYQEHAELVAQDEEWFDLTPIEKKLCGISLGLGISLMVIFLAFFRL